MHVGGVLRALQCIRAALSTAPPSKGERETHRDSFNRPHEHIRSHGHTAKRVGQQESVEEKQSVFFIIGVF